MRPVLHTTANWLMLTARDAVPKTHALAKAEFATLRIKFLKIGARIRETAHGVRIAFAAACPDAALVREPDRVEKRALGGRGAGDPGTTQGLAALGLRWLCTSPGTTIVT
jgi:Transposase DDE domain group 1